MGLGCKWAGLLAVAGAVHPEIVRAASLGQIMPLGDSITWGDDYPGGFTTGKDVPVPGGYRQELYSNLTAAGYTFNFVGTLTTNSTAALSAAKQSANDGHTGYQIGSITNSLDGSDALTGDAGHWLTGLGTRSAILPDTILLMAGTNDLSAGIAPATDVDINLDALISKIFALRPNVHLYVSDLLPMPGLPAANVNVWVWNALLPTEVAKFASLGRSITLVHSNAAFLNANGTENSLLLGDGVHPNSTGYPLEGDVWTAALLGGKSVTVTGAVHLASASANGIAPLALSMVKISSGGTLELDKTANRAVMVASSLSIIGGVLNLHDNDLIVHGGVLSDIVAQIKQGNIKGDSGGVLGAVVNNNGAGQLLNKTFDGQTLVASDVLVKRTIMGDANLDGTVGFVDLLAVARNYDDSRANWSVGDFNYDGKTNFSDLLALAQHYRMSASNEEVGELQAAAGATFAAEWAQAQVQADSVPEPVGAMVILMAGAGSLRRKRR